MKKKSTYSDLLKHPKWQKKRLLIMERDNFQCQMCGCENKSLNVHHFYYKKGVKPWQYSNEALITLCEDCHKIEEDEKRVQLAGLLSTMEICCIPSCFVKMLTSTLLPFANKPEELKQFIVDIQKESYKRNKLIDISKVVEMAHKISQNIAV